MSGRRHSKEDHRRIRAIREAVNDLAIRVNGLAVELGDDDWSEDPTPETLSTDAPAPVRGDVLVAFGDAVKALGDGRVAGYLIRFSDPRDPRDRDLEGQYFTAKTYFGPRDGDGVDAYFHHAIPVRGDLAHLADRTFAPLKVTRDEVGLFAETVLNMADEYERMIYDLAVQGKLGWSSGAPGHLVRVAADGAILRWPVAEGSLTPTPAEPRNRAIPLKTLPRPEASPEDPDGSKGQAAPVYIIVP